MSSLITRVVPTLVLPFITWVLGACSDAEPLNHVNSILIDGEPNACPAAPSIHASARRAKLGSPIALNGKSSDPDGDPIAYLWDAESGIFADFASQATSFTCSEPGEVALTLNADDGRGCVREALLTVTCTEAPEAAQPDDYASPLLLGRH